MAETGLQARPLGAGITHSIGETTLSVIARKELLAIAYPPAMAAQVEVALGALPTPATSTALSTGQRILWVGVGQLLCFGTSPLGEAATAAKLEDSGYVTDLSDGWIALDLSGPDAQARLDLLTLPDLSDEAFAVGAVTSTPIGHLRVVIWRKTQTQFVLLSAASSALSLIQTLQDELALLDRVSETIR